MLKVIEYEFNDQIYTDEELLSEAVREYLSQEFNGYPSDSDVEQAINDYVEVLEWNKLNI